MYIHIYIYICIYIYLFTHMHIFSYICIYKINIYIHIHIYIYDIRIYVYVYKYIYIWYTCTHTHMHMHTHARTNWNDKYVSSWHAARIGQESYITSKKDRHHISKKVVFFFTITQGCNAARHVSYTYVTYRKDQYEWISQTFHMNNITKRPVQKIFKIHICTWYTKETNIYEFHKKIDQYVWISQYMCMIYKKQTSMNEHHNSYMYTSHKKSKYIWISQFIYVHNTEKRSIYMNFTIHI